MKKLLLALIAATAIFVSAIVIIESLYKKAIRDM